MSGLRGAELRRYSNSATRAVRSGVGVRGGVLINVRHICFGKLNEGFM